MASTTSVARIPPTKFLISASVRYGLWHYVLLDPDSPWCWPANFSGGSGLGFCVTEDGKSRAGTRLFGSESLNNLGKRDGCTILAVFKMATSVSPRQTTRANHLTGIDSGGSPARLSGSGPDATRPLVLR